MLKSFVMFILFSIPAFAVFAKQEIPVLGCWKTIDDQSGKERSVVCIRQHKESPRLYGYIAKILDQSVPKNPLCVKCEGELKDRPILNMNILLNLEKTNSDEWEGKIMDPESGSVYDCKIWIEHNVLKVRGYLLFLYRTQSWPRISEAELFPKNEAQVKSKTKKISGHTRSNNSAL